MINDSIRLDWMIFNSASVHFSNDDEFCWVSWCDRDGLYKTDKYDSSRDAIDEAIYGNYIEL